MRCILSKKFKINQNIVNNYKNKLNNNRYQNKNLKKNKRIKYKNYNKNYMIFKMKKKRISKNLRS